MFIEHWIYKAATPASPRTIARCHPMAPSRITAAAELVGAGLVGVLGFTSVGLLVIVTFSVVVLEGKNVVLVTVE